MQMCKKLNERFSLGRGYHMTARLQAARESMKHRQISMEIEMLVLIFDTDGRRISFCGVSLKHHGLENNRRMLQRRLQNLAISFQIRKCAPSQSMLRGNGR